MKRAFVVVSQANWVAEDFVAGLGDRHLITSYGLDLPQLKEWDAVSWWMPAAFAARVQRLGLAGGLTAPGPQWMPSVPHELSQRVISAEPLKNFLTLADTEKHYFVKPAEAKMDFFEASWRTVDEAKALVAEQKFLPEESIVQYTESLLDFSEEHRFYILDGQVMTGSVYLAGGVTYYDGATSQRSREAEQYASEAALALSDNQPRAYTLDVGYDTLGERWTVIEGNPAWCSGLYGSDPAQALKVIDISCTGVGEQEKFLWVPDPYLASAAQRKVLLQQRDI